MLSHSLSLSLPTIAFAETVIIAKATIAKTEACPSGYQLVFSDGTRCIENRDKDHLDQHLGFVKLAHAYKKNVKFKGEKLQEVRLIAFDPPQEAGTSYEKKSGWSTFNDALTGVANAYNAQQGISPPGAVYTPPAASPQPAPSAQTSNTPATLTPVPLNRQVVDSSIRYVDGVNRCVGSSAGPHGLMFHNLCADRVNIVWTNTTGGRGSLSLAAGESGDGWMTNTSGGATGKALLYACPGSSYAVDVRNNAIYAPVTDYRCIPQ